MWRIFRRVHGIFKFFKLNKIQYSQVDSTFYPLWDGKMSTSQRAVMLCGWGVKAGMV